jgi:hypothetical protein
MIYNIIVKQEQTPKVENKNVRILIIFLSVLMSLPSNIHAEQNVTLSQADKATLIQRLELAERRAGFEGYSAGGYQCAQDPKCQAEYNTISKANKLVEYAKPKDINIIGAKNLREMLVIRASEILDKDLTDEILNNIPKQNNIIDDLGNILEVYTQLYGYDNHELKTRYDFTRTLRMMLTDGVGDCEDSALGLNNLATARGYDAYRLDYSKIDGHSMVGIKFNDYKDIIKAINESSNMTKYIEYKTKTSKWYRPDSRVDAYQVIIHADKSAMLVIDPTSSNYLEPSQVKAPIDPVTNIKKALSFASTNKDPSSTIDPFQAGTQVVGIYKDIKKAEGTGYIHYVNYVNGQEHIQHELTANQKDIIFAGNLQDFINK